MMPAALFRPFLLVQDRSGAAAVEFALMLPIIVFGFLGMADLSFSTYEKMRLDQLARDVAAAAMDGLSSAELETVLAAQIANSTTIGGGTMSGLVDETGSCAGSTVVYRPATGVRCPDGSLPNINIDIVLNLIHPAFVLGTMTLESRLRLQYR